MLEVERCPPQADPPWAGNVQPENNIETTDGQGLTGVALNATVPTNDRVPSHDEPVPRLYPCESVFIRGSFNSGSRVHGKQLGFFFVFSLASLRLGVEM